MKERWRCIQTKEHSSNSEIWRWQHHGLRMFFAKGTGNISVIDGRINASAYQNILEANLMNSVENL